MNALTFTPSKTTVSMDPVPLVRDEAAPQSGERKMMWMVRTSDGMVGPVSLDLIERGLNLGKVPEDAEVAPANTTDWRPVRDVLREIEAESLSPQSVERADPIVAAPVVPVGQPEFEWPESFAPSASTSIVPQSGQTELGAMPFADPGQAVAGATEVGAMPFAEPAPMVQASPLPYPPAQALAGQTVGAAVPYMQTLASSGTAAQTTMPSATPYMAAPAVGGQTLASQGNPYVAPPVIVEEPIEIPTTGMSPAVIAFGATIAVAALVGIAVAIIQAL